MPTTFPFGQSAASGDIQIIGYEETMAANRKMIEALHPRSGLGDAVRTVVLDLQQYAVGVTHVWTGALRSSHRVEFSAMGDQAEGVLFVTPATRNPITGDRPAVYGLEEEKRGGDHAFYMRTYQDRGDTALTLGVDRLERWLNG